MNRFTLTALISVILSTLSQVLLKISSSEVKKSFIYEYLNIKVIVAYGISFLCMFMMVYAFKGMDYKHGAVIESLAYLFIMLFGGVILKEKITPKRVIGNCIIIIGVLIFNMGK